MSSPLMLEHKRYSILKRVLRALFKKPAITAFVSLLSLASFVTAGSLTPPGAPASTMNTLAEIFDSIAGTFNSASITANQNGSLIEVMKYVEDQLAWASSSNNVFALSAGNYGIGDSTPEARFEVVGQASVSALTVNGVSITGGGGSGVTSNSLDFDEFVNDMALDADLSIASAGFNTTWNGDTYFMQGNVGIGTNTPSSTLEVLGNFYAVDGFSYVSLNTLNTDTFETLAGNTRLMSNGANTTILEFGLAEATFLQGYGDGDFPVVLQQNDGNVGIGTTTPDFKLEVAGTASSSALFGSGLTDCDTALTSKLLWNVSTGLFSCGTDQGGGSSVGSNSLDFDEFANTMTLDANLVINSSGFGWDMTNTNFETSGTASLSNSLFVAESIGAGIPRVGIGTNNPEEALDIANGSIVLRADFSGIYKDNDDDSALFFDNAQGLAINSALNTTVNIRSNGINDARAFRVNANGVGVTGGTNLFTVLSTGEVGIGTTTPTTKLDISGSASVSQNFEVDGTASLSNSLFVASGGRVGVGTSAPEDQIDIFGVTNGLRLSYDLENFGRMYVDSAGTLFVDSVRTAGPTSPTNVVLTSTGGNVGIGDPNPSSKLSVYGNIFASASGDIDLILRSSSATGDEGLFRLRSAGVSDRLDFLNQSTVLMSIASGGNIGIGTTTPNAKLSVFADSTYTDDASAGIKITNPNLTNRSLHLGATNGSGGYIQYVRDGVGGQSLTINPNGYAGVDGGSVGIGAATPTMKLHVLSTSDESILRLQDSDGTCDHNPESGAETVSCSSDERLKSNIHDAPSALEYLQDFRIREYVITSSGDVTTGIIAQELMQTHPELVSSSSSGYLMVEQPNPWILIKGIQELRAQVDSLSQQLGTGNEVSSPMTSVGSGWAQWNFSTLFSSIVTAFTDVLGVVFQPGGRIKANELCLEDVCVTKDRLQEILERAGQETGGNTLPSPSPTPEIGAMPSPSGSVSPSATPSSTAIPAPSSSATSEPVNPSPESTPDEDPDLTDVPEPEEEDNGGEQLPVTP
jgi:hypothetical protein